MSNEDLMKDPAYANRIAAHQLMTQWVKDNASEVAHSISELTSYICGENNLASMQRSLNTINVTFATIALEVVKQRNESEAEGNKRMPLCLPADAIEMQNALYDFSRFMKRFAAMAHMIELNENMPAFRMSVTAYDEVDSI